MKSFEIDECSVNHGDISVGIIKDGCFATLLNAKPLDESNHSRVFAFQVFKGSDVDSTSQELVCTVTVCQTGDCSKPRSNEECPNNAADRVFEYSIDGSPTNSGEQ